MKIFMGRQVVMCTLLAVTAIGVNGVWAGGAGDDGNKVMGEEVGRPLDMMLPLPPSPEEVLGHLKRHLKLTSDQQTKITADTAAEWKKMTQLARQVGDYRAQLREAGNASVFDEAAVQAIAVKLAQAEAELIVAGERVRSKVNALLTPEQRAAAATFPPPFHRGQGPGERPGCGRRCGCMPPPPPCGCGRGRGDEADERDVLLDPDL